MDRQFSHRLILIFESKRTIRNNFKILGTFRVGNKRELLKFKEGNENSSTSDFRRRTYQDYFSLFTVYN